MQQLTDLDLAIIEVLRAGPKNVQMIDAWLVDIKGLRVSLSEVYEALKRLEKLGIIQRQVNPYNPEFLSGRYEISGTDILDNHLSGM